MISTEHVSVARTSGGTAVHERPSGLGMAQILAAQIYGLPLEALLAGTRGSRRAAEARQVAMYLGHVVFRLSLAAIGRGFGRDRTTASHACRRIEVRREDPGFERRLLWMERMLRDASGVDDLPAGAQ